MERTEPKRPDLKAKYFTIRECAFITEKYVGGSTCITAISMNPSSWDRERISVNLASYGFIAPEGFFYAKNYSEMEGLPDALEESGLAKKVRKLFVGPFSSECWLMEIVK